MSAFYNEFDGKAAAWLRELISAEQISTGVVDERSITELIADDVRGHERVHLFAGIGGWDLALQLAGWPEGREVWTGSCPCQPFSSAGKGLGEADERHLWPEMLRLIAECRPAVVLGEQVASKAGRKWFSGVRLNLEALDYAVGAADLCAAGVGAPHIRQRLYWVAYAKGRNGRLPVLERQPRQNSVEPEWCSGTLGLADAWSDYRIIGFRDGKTRRIESGTEPLVDGLPRGMVPSGDISLPYVRNTGDARVMRLKGYGNAIVPQVAAAFVRAFMEAVDD